MAASNATRVSKFSQPQPQAACNNYRTVSNCNFLTSAIDRSKLSRLASRARNCKNGNHSEVTTHISHTSADTTPHAAARTVMSEDE